MEIGDIQGIIYDSHKKKFEELKMANFRGMDGFGIREIKELKYGYILYKK